MQNQQVTGPWLQGIEGTVKKHRFAVKMHVVALGIPAHNQCADDASAPENKHGVETVVHSGTCSRLEIMGIVLGLWYFDFR